MIGIRMPTSPVLSLLAAGGTEVAPYQASLRAVHHDFCAVAMARLKVEYLLGSRALLRSLHERLVTMMESFMVPLRGLVSTSLITNANHALDCKAACRQSGKKWRKCCARLSESALPSPLVRRSVLTSCNSVWLRRLWW